MTTSGGLHIHGADYQRRPEVAERRVAEQLIAQVVQPLAPIQRGSPQAERLVSFITSDPAMTRFGLPVAVFATRTTKDGNGQRSQETVDPLAQRL